MPENCKGLHGPGSQEVLVIGRVSFVSGRSGGSWNGGRGGCQLSGLPNGAPEVQITSPGRCSQDGRGRKITNTASNTDLADILLRCCLKITALEEYLNMLALTEGWRGV